MLNQSDRISALVDEGTAVNIVCLNLNKTFFNVFPKVYFYKQMKYRLSGSEVD